MLRGPVPLWTALPGPIHFPGLLRQQVLDGLEVSGRVCVHISALWREQCLGYA